MQRNALTTFEMFDGLLSPVHSRQRARARK